ncbi:neutrophil defensin 1 isoform 2 preproprotein [Daubentonia madagascariensis]|uniref:Neutrophil defensin 1 isoform 2 preproprotein n=2 Tax=Daubentonia madagascariensis TaxID=31869 RepID=A0ABD2D494_DAUMA
MRTLALLAALLLVALQAQAGPLHMRAEDEEAPDQELPGDEDQDVAMSIMWDVNSIPQAPGLVTSAVCVCRRLLCTIQERRSGSCIYRGRSYPLCCR